MIPRRRLGGKIGRKKTVLKKTSKDEGLLLATAGHGGVVGGAGLRGGSLRRLQFWKVLIDFETATSLGDGPDPDACGNPATVP